mmetsp:Transcript_44061/g.64658  ORF Transcript_44061/g.64658 Transcript_44061/m.64658 type:complete len:88 (-) Transcript_44061:153-416(-)
MLLSQRYGLRPGKPVSLFFWQDLGHLQHMWRRRRHVCTDTSLACFAPTIFCASFLFSIYVCFGWYAVVVICAVRDKYGSEGVLEYTV